jgi:hypothetical protein
MSAAKPSHTVGVDMAADVGLPADEGKHQVVVVKPDARIVPQDTGALITMKVRVQLGAPTGMHVHVRMPVRMAHDDVAMLQDVSYTVKHRKTKKDLAILSHVNGFFQPGQMSALVRLLLTHRASLMGNITPRMPADGLSQHAT